MPWENYIMMGNNSRVNKQKFIRYMTFIKNVL